MAKKETGVFFIFDDQRKKVKKPATFFFWISNQKKDYNISGQNEKKPSASFLFEKNKKY